MVLFEMRFALHHTPVDVILVCYGSYSRLAGIVVDGNRLEGEEWVLLDVQEDLSSLWLAVLAWTACRAL